MPPYWALLLLQRHPELQRIYAMEVVCRSAARSQPNRAAAMTKGAKTRATPARESTTGLCGSNLRLDSGARCRSRGGLAMPTGRARQRLSRLETKWAQRPRRGTLAGGNRTRVSPHQHRCCLRRDFPSRLQAILSRKTGKMPGGAGREVRLSFRTYKNRRAAHRSAAAAQRA
jgi:hypothetical protein